MSNDESVSEKKIAIENLAKHCESLKLISAKFYGLFKKGERVWEIEHGESEGIVKEKSLEKCFMEYQRENFIYSGKIEFSQILSKRLQEIREAMKNQLMNHIYDAIEMKQKEFCRKPFSEEFKELFCFICTDHKNFDSKDITREEKVMQIYESIPDIDNKVINLLDTINKFYQLETPSLCTLLEYRSQISDFQLPK